MPTDRLGQSRDRRWYTDRGLCPTVNCCVAHRGDCGRDDGCAVRRGEATNRQAQTPLPASVSASPEVGQVWSDGVIERTIVAQVRKRDDWVVKARIIGNPAPVKDVVLPGWLFEQGRCGKLVEAADASSPERRVVCENCGEVIETEPIGGPLDTEPELGAADHLVPADECPLCSEEEG